MAKRSLDVAVALLGLLLGSPFLLAALAAVWLQDRRSPFYLAPRVGRGDVPFAMVKVRSMSVRTGPGGFDSTAASDPRITPVGRIVRRFKVDELGQFWNVLRGDMSLVGPRPQVAADVARYTAEERRMLQVRPGITDLASIVFADEGDILDGATDPDAEYNRIIRPWKSRLALAYLGRASVRTDLRILGLTAIGLVSRSIALRGVQAILGEWRADGLLRRMAAREEPLLPYPPPGAEEPSSVP